MYLQYICVFYLSLPNAVEDSKKDCTSVIVVYSEKQIQRKCLVSNNGLCYVPTTLNLRNYIIEFAYV